MGRKDDYESKELRPGVSVLLLECPGLLGSNNKLYGEGWKRKRIATLGAGSPTAYRSRLASADDFLLQNLLSFAMISVCPPVSAYMT